MLYTAQTFADSGNFAAPWGTDSLHHCFNRDDVNSVLDKWGDDVNFTDDRKDAYLMVWCREHLNDVTDLYPDFKVCYGPRGGIRWETV